MNLESLSSKLVQESNGIWTSDVRHQAKIHFPETGYADCFRIEDDSFWFSHRNECIVRALKRYPFDGPFIDIGGGNGAVSARLQSEGIDTAVIEPGEEGARNAKQRGIRHVICSTLDEAAFEPGAFGGAGLFDVIEHVEADVDLLRGAHRILRRGGVLAVTVPAYDALWSAEDVVAGHHRRYTLSKLRDVLVGSEFEVAYSTYFFAPLTLPLFFARSLRYRLGLRDTSGADSAARIESDAARQHTPNPVARRVIAGLLAPETKRIGMGRSIPFGTSCLAIAHAR